MGAVPRGEALLPWWWNILNRWCWEIHWGYCCPHPYQWWHHSHSNRHWLRGKILARKLSYFFHVLISQNTHLTSCNAHRMLWTSSSHVCLCLSIHHVASPDIDKNSLRCYCEYGNFLIFMSVILQISQSLWESSWRVLDPHESHCGDFLILIRVIIVEISQSSWELPREISRSSWEFIFC